MCFYFLIIALKMSLNLKMFFTNCACFSEHVCNIILNVQHYMTT